MFRTYYLGVILATALSLYSLSGCSNGDDNVRDVLKEHGITEYKEWKEDGDVKIVLDRNNSPVYIEGDSIWRKVSREDLAEIERLLRLTFNTLPEHIVDEYYTGLEIKFTIRDEDWAYSDGGIRRIN